MRDGYKRLNLSKLNSRPRKTMSIQEALSQVDPIQFIDDVYNETKKVQIDKQGIQYVPNR
nr:MAG TPA: hypothetical protein [Caudoviricetes sp.]DAU04519.1 MAG TPA: hypothetical protein [Caudoviricetes sp.]